MANVPWTSAVARIGVGGSHGTGFLVSETGLVLTAFHVIADRTQSLEKRQLVRRPFPIEVKFGDGKKETRDGGTAVLVANRYSIDEDWALLRLEDSTRSFGVPLKPAKLDPKSALRNFAAFGFPRAEAENGGEYTGTFGVWAEPAVGIVEASIDQSIRGMNMGGISGGPCMIDGHVVAMIVQALADDRGNAVKDSLYVVPIERAMRGCEGIAWDDGAPMLFEDTVADNLPDAPTKLASIARKLAPPWAEERRMVARRLLSSELAAAAAALRAGKLAAEQAKEIIECLGAMQLHADSVEHLQRSLQRSLKEPRLTVLASERRRVHGWYLRRAYEPQEVPELFVAVIRGRPGDEESPAGSAIAAVVEEIVVRLKQRLVDNGVGTTLIAGMLTKDSAEKRDGRRFWAILIDEMRLDVLAAVRARLPNARVIAGSNAALAVPEALRDLVDIITPTMSASDELELVESWESMAAKLKIKLPQEEADS